MKKSHKVAITSAIASVIVGVGIAGSSFAANTQTQKGPDNRPQPTAEQRAAHDAEMKTRLDNDLSTAVKNGKLTEDQKAHIEDVMNQIHTKMEAGDKTGAKALHDELEKWMSDNKIDPSVLPTPMGRHGSPEEMKAHLTSKLDQEVKDGKITSDQEKHILDTMEQIHTKMEAGDKTGAKTLQDDLKKWADDQNIDASMFPGPHPHGPHHNEAQ